MSVEISGLQILEDVSLEIAGGGALGVFGPNGSGKSTLLKTIVGLRHPMRGSIALNGESIAALRPQHVARAGVVLVPQGRRLFARMTVEENLRLGAESVGRTLRVRDLLDRWLHLFPDLIPKLRVDAGNLSGGQQQMVAIARGLMADPKILMLDEPSLGVAPIIQETIVEVLENVRRQGVGIIIVEQNVPLALRLVDNAMVLVNGRVSAAGEVREFQDQERLARLFFGVTPHEPRGRTSQVRQRPNQNAEPEP